MNNFKKKYAFKHRFDEVNRIVKKFPDRIPVIVQKNIRSNIQDIDKHKFLVPYDLTIGQFIYIIRKRIKLDPQKSIFMFIENTIPTTSTLMSEIYNQYKDTDGFLYITYSGENTFG